MVTETEYLLLSALIYNRDLSLDINRGKTISAIFEKKTSPDNMLTEAEWQDAITLMRENENISSMTVAASFANEDTCMACLVTKSGETVVVFKGAGCSGGEWTDTVIGITKSSTPLQLQALNWVNSLSFDNITAVGHCTGGNKAMFVSIKSEKIKECYAFNSFGFSDAFVSENRVKIEKIKEHIHSISNYRDPCMLNSISGDIRYYSNGKKIKTLLQYHTAMTLFKHRERKPTFSFPEKAPQSVAIKTLGDCVDYVLSNMERGERDVLLESLRVKLGVLFSTHAKNNSSSNANIFSPFTELWPSVKDYVSTFLSDFEKNEPREYSRFISDLYSIAKEEVGVIKANIAVAAVKSRRW